MPGPQAFLQVGAYFTVPGRTCADLTAWHRKARRRFSDLLFLQLAQCTQEGMNTSPYKIISPRHNTVQRQVSGANLFYYRCSTLSLISAVRPWFQNWVPM